MLQVQYQVDSAGVASAHFIPVGDLASGFKAIVLFGGKRLGLTTQGEVQELGAVVAFHIFETHFGDGLQGAVGLFAEQASDCVELCRKGALS